MANYTDTFTAANGTRVDARAADTGQTYSTNAVYKINTNRAYADNNSVEEVIQVLESDGTTPYVTADEYDLTIDFYLATNVGNIGVLFASSDADNLYMIRMRSESLQLFKKEAGTFTLLGEETGLSTASTNYIATVEVRAADLTVKRGGSTVIGPIADTTHARAGNLFLRSNEGSTTATNGYQISQIDVVELLVFPTTAFPGQSRTISGSGFGATQGTGGVTIDGVSQTITSWSDTSVTFTTVLGDNSYGTGKPIVLTNDAAETLSDTIELVADTAGGFGYVEMLNPDTSDESSVAFGATPTVVTGDQFEWEDFNSLNLSVDAQGFVTVDTAGTFRGRFWDATDGTWGAVNTFTASEGDVWPFPEDTPSIPKTWEWGERHPLTQARVRLFKGGS